ncbi:MAG TPA: carotenoid biosynthesis protein [Deltaproteobacteria bacterium]|nr:carotenoid biosynthesis protein [Deltaproteobacteria bacterium]
MYELLRLLWGTILLRPYVFAFLAVYLVAGWRHIGWKRTLAFIPLGYAFAWISEFSSIHWGFPYGDYFYIQNTAHRELWVFGVPFMDSLSYVFLSYCSYSLAVFLMSPVTLWSGNLITLETSRIRRSWQTLILGAFLFVLLDIVIDPVALQGERWFLGRIYGYRHEGFYFGIPISNFAGWLFVGAVLTDALQALEWIFSVDPRLHSPEGRLSWMRLLGPALYFSVLLFNITVTFYIGEMLLGLVDLLLLSVLLVPMILFTFYKNSNTSAEAVYTYFSRSSMSGDSRSLPLNLDFTRNLAQQRGWNPQKSGH